MRRRFAAAAVAACAAIYITSPAQAENGCPAGYEPWRIPVESQSDCVAIPDYGAQEQPASPPSRSGPGFWATRWGALATGASPQGTVLGTSSNALSRGSAEAEALGSCQAQGGGESCEIELSYYNQCAAIVWGNNNGTSARAETVRIAEDLALNKCELLTDNCKVYYSACSMPVWIGA